MLKKKKITYCTFLQHLEYNVLKWGSSSQDYLESGRKEKIDKVIHFFKITYFSSPMLTCILESFFLVAL